MRAYQGHGREGIGRPARLRDLAEPVTARVEVLDARYLAQAPAPLQTRWRVRREEELQRVADAVTAAGGTALVVPTDVERDEDLDTLLRLVRAELGPVDVLVNTAGVATFQHVHELDAAALDRQLRVNLRAPTLLCAAVLPQMRERGHGPQGGSKNKALNSHGMFLRRLEKGSGGGFARGS